MSSGKKAIRKFRVWAPEKKRMVLHIQSPCEQFIEMEKGDGGYFFKELEADEGTRYFFRPDDENGFPDPASHSQPDGVHAASELVDHTAFTWTDSSWKGVPFKELILYELHVGTFTPEGTFEAIIPRLKSLRDIGINAIELLPVTQFPGGRNWGYDGVYPYAVQNSYGGPSGLKRLVDACHNAGIAVFLDLVYNHLGPEGNYLSQFGPYFTSNYCTPWGDAINFDGEWSDGVRDFFSDNALFWFKNYHIDGLRLDAIHMVFDNGAVHFWEYLKCKLKEMEQRMGRKLFLIAESDLNSPKVVRPAEIGGWGFDAQWLDDFHHALYVLLDKNGRERYADFGRIEHLAKAYTDGFVHSGEFVTFRKRKHGASSAGVPGDKFVVFNQNHDQVGNRVLGERLCMLVDFERTKVAAAAVLLSPYVPMLFMGEEYADDTPFFYFVSHSDKELIKAVQEGRKKEFQAFNWNVSPPDPQSEKTFQDSKLRWHKRTKGKHAIMLAWHKHLIQLRKTRAVFAAFNKNYTRAWALSSEVLLISRQSEDEKELVYCFFNFSDRPFKYLFPGFTRGWRKIVDSKEEQWMEAGEARSLAEYEVAGAGDVLIAPCSVVVFEALVE